jgi:formylglycine-generating enzyme required for sulfatase activity
VKGPKLPVRNLPCADVRKFCQILSEKNGRTVRLPGEAEWEYAARVGASNPPLDAKYRDQDSSGEGRGVLLPVKSKQPNAWGLYDMISNVFEMTRDKFIVGLRADAVDPYDSCEQEEASGKPHGHWGRNRVTYHESVPSGGAKDDAQYPTAKFRVLVEATPDEIAAMEKAAKK